MLSPDLRFALLKKQPVSFMFAYMCVFVYFICTDRGKNEAQRLGKTTETSRMGSDRRRQSLQMEKGGESCFGPTPSGDQRDHRSGDLETNRTQVALATKGTDENLSGDF